MNGNWIKVVLFVLGIVMIASIVSALLDAGLGKPDNARRTRHPAGFSISYPLGWGGTAAGNSENDTSYIRLAPERKTGRETSITVFATGATAKTRPAAKPGTFQDQPAFYSQEKGSRDWMWRVQFERDGNWYEILFVSPLQIEVEKSAYWPFIDSFRIEKPILSATTRLVAPDAPAVVPAE